jgi:hypothetical protein
VLLGLAGGSISSGALTAPKLVRKTGWDTEPGDIGVEEVVITLEIERVLDSQPRSTLWEGILPVWSAVITFVLVIPPYRPHRRSNYVVC